MKSLFSSLIISFIFFLILSGAFKWVESTFSNFVSFYAWTYIISVVLSLLLNFATYLYWRYTFAKWAKRWNVPVEVVENAMFGLGMIRIHKLQEMDKWSAQDFARNAAINLIAHKIIANALRID